MNCFDRTRPQALCLGLVAAWLFCLGGCASFAPTPLGQMSLWRPPTGGAGSALPASGAAETQLAAQSQAPLVRGQYGPPPQQYQAPPASYPVFPGTAPPAGAYDPNGTIVVTPQGQSYPAAQPAAPPQMMAPGGAVYPQGQIYAQPGQTVVAPPGSVGLPPPVAPPSAITPFDTTFGLPSVMDPVPPTADLDIFVDETRTGRFMFGVGVNSDAGVTGQIVVDERNFDITRVPTSFDEILNGTAFRGAGQGFRLEAMPGTQVQRYLVSFTEPYFMDTNVSMSLSGFYYDRGYFDWAETRMGGRVASGYRLTPDLSLTGAVRLETIEIHNIRAPAPELLEVQGDNELYSGQISLQHDTRDVPFFPTEGHLFEVSFEQAFGSFTFPKVEFDFRQYFLLRERPDGSGRHTLGYSFRTGFAGSNTPVYEHFFAGGHSTLRGFDFRGASPVSTGGAVVGGEFRMLGSVEYFFPLNASDMVKGVLFVDFGTVEEKIQIKTEDYRIAPGFGLRIFVPAMGPAPIALDFAVPIAREDTDDIQNFSFFVGFNR